jgi:hypothetical protein
MKQVVREMMRVDNVEMSDESIQELVSEMSDEDLRTIDISLLIDNQALIEQAYSAEAEEMTP